MCSAKDSENESIIHKLRRICKFLVYCTHVSTISWILKTYVIFVKRSPNFVIQNSTIKMYEFPIISYDVLKFINIKNILTNISSQVTQTRKTASNLKISIS